MKSLALTLTLLLAMLIVSGPAPAQMTNQPSMTMEKTVTTTATVVGIDRADREVTLQGPQGNIMTVDVDPSVTSFDQIKVGDKVSVDYYQSMSMALGPKGQQPSQSTAAVVGRGPEAKPEGYAIHTIETTAVVKSINRANRAVTLQGPTGELFTVSVPPEMKAFDQLKVGDSVQTQYTEATAIALRKQ